MNMIEYAKNYVNDCIKKGIIDKNDIHTVFRRDGEIDNGVILLCGESAYILVKKLPKPEGVSFSAYTHHQLIMSFKGMVTNGKKKVAVTKAKKHRGRKAQPLNISKTQCNVIKEMYEAGNKVSVISRETNIAYHKVMTFLKRNGLKK